MEKKNTGLMVLVIILSLLVLGLSGYIVYDKVLSKEDVSNDVQNVNDESNDIVKEEDINLIDYKFGDEVVISNLSSVKDYYYPGDIQDFSKWYVLSSDDKTVTLLSDNSWGKGDKIYTDISTFEKYGVNVIETRGLNEIELGLFGCDFDTLECNNVPEWGGYTITSISNDEYFISISENKLEKYPRGMVLVQCKPVIKILKTEIK